jgi:hypothetical protein
MSLNVQVLCMYKISNKINALKNTASMCAISKNVIQWPPYISKLISQFMLYDNICSNWDHVQ